MTESRYFYGLDILRFTSAVLVMLFHLGWWGWLPATTGAAILAPPTGATPPLEQMWMGWIGVQIFFVLSGFVIANTAVHVTPIEFLKHRLVRLYPAVWICATISLLIVLPLGFMKSPLLVYINSMLLLPFRWRISPVYWTLTPEITFYLLIFFTKAYVPSVTVKRLATALLIWSAPCVLLSLLHTGTGRLIALLLLLRHGMYFSIGLFLWLHSTRGLSRSEWVQLLLAVVLGAIEIIRTANETPGHSVNTAAQFAEPITLWATAVAFVFLVTTRVAWQQWLSAGIRAAVRQAGLMTYPIYLVHVELGGRLAHFLLLAGAGARLSVLAAASGVVAASFCIVNFGERPLQRALRSFLGRF